MATTGRHQSSGSRRWGRRDTTVQAGAGDGVRRDLQGLRAIAVLGVVVYHLRKSWLPGGFAGVDVFFVLSGFFITGLLLREIDRGGRVDLLRFWGRRARRLLPASVLVILVTVVAGYLMTNPLEAHRIGRDGLYASVFGMNWLSAYQQTQYLQDPNPSPLVHYWSLGVEEQFYVFWPVLLLGLALLYRVTRSGGPMWMRRQLTPRRTLFVLGVVVGALSFLLALSQTTSDNSYAYFGTFERVWQLALGGVLAVLIGRLERLPGWLRLVSRYVGVALIVVFYFAASTDIVYPGRKALIPALGAALIIAAGTSRLRSRDPLTWLLGTRPSQLGGQYSYSWYLWHYPPIVLLPIYLERPLRIRELGLVALGTFLLAALTYHLLENPVRSSNWLAMKRSGRSLVLGAVLIVLALGSSQGVLAAADHDANDSQIRTANGTLLVPQPAVALKEMPQPYSNGCIAGTNVDNLAKECRYLPDTGKGDVIEVGDSHAAMWFPAVLQIAKNEKWGFRFWARNSCPFADITKSVSGKQYLPCDAWRADVMRRLVKAHPSLVIIASLDSGLPPFYRRDAAGKPTNKLIGGVPARQLWADGYERNLKILRRAGINVLVIHDTPGYPHAMTGPDCVLAHPTDLDKCSLPQSQAMPGAPNDLSAAKKVGGVSTIDFTKVFCRGGRCYQVIGSTLAYRDYNHLSAQMTGELRPRLEKAAVAAMNRK